MAKTMLVWSGLSEYLEELKKLPEDCTAEALKLIENETNAAYVAVAQVYGAHQYTGTLRKRLTLSPLKHKGQFIAGLELKSGSPLAWLFDNGTQARHYVTVNGKTHVTGKMPGLHIFSRTVGKARRRLAQQYRDLLIRRGAATVTGE